MLCMIGFTFSYTQKLVKNTKTNEAKLNALAKNYIILPLWSGATDTQGSLKIVALDNLSCFIYKTRNYF